MVGDSSEVCSKCTPAQKKILLIDDQGDPSLCIGLQQEGYEVIAVESPRKAWGVVWTIRPHFIIIHLTNLSRGDIYTLQGCGVLAGGVPIIGRFPGTYPPNYNEGTHLISGKGPTRLQVVPN
jgi:hypothetical protein